MAAGGAWRAAALLWAESESESARKEGLGSRFSGAMTKLYDISRTLGGLLLATALVACGSDDDGSASGSGGSTSTGGTTATGGGSSTGGTSSATGGTSSATGGSSTGGDGAAGDTGNPADPSQECLDYCTGPTGFVQKCSGHIDADLPFQDEDDCLSQCAAQSNWDLECRALHLQNSNGSDIHCYHAIGQEGSCEDL